MRPRSRWRILAGLAASLFLAAGDAFAADVSVVLVVDRTGAVDAIRQGVASPVQVLAELSIGSRLRLQDAATVTLLYMQTGDAFILRGPGESELRPDAPLFDAARMQRQRAGLGPARLPVENVALGGVVMRSGAPRPRYPEGRVTARPLQLAWRAIQSDAVFHVELRDAAGTVLFQQEVAGLSVALPSDLALGTRRPYTWSVSIAGKEARAIPARFEIVDTELQAVILGARPSATASFADRVIQGLWLEQIGAIGEARQQWETLAAERPGEAAVLARSRR